MKARKLIGTVGVLVLIAVLAVTAVSTAFAQDATPTPGTKTFPWGRGLERGFGFWGGGKMADFDALAKALNLTPTQLFEELHSGKTLDEIAKAQGVDLTQVQEALRAARLQAMKEAIAQAVKDGKMTQEQADWLLEGLEKGYMPGGRGHFGCDPMGRGGFHGFGGKAPKSAPSTPAPGTSS